MTRPVTRSAIGSSTGRGGRPPSRGRALAGAAAVLAVGTVTVPLTGASPAAAVEAECSRDVTRYVSDSSYAIAALGLPQSWTLATGKGVTVAVVDSGVDPRNKHLEGAVVPGTSFIPGDPTGRTDALGHGTGVAGIIAARPVKGSALVGAAPDATILPVRVFESDVTDQDPSPRYPPDGTTIAKGIRWAAAHGADVINVSMSSPAGDAGVPAMKAAVAFAHRKDVVVVASGGNYVPPADAADASEPTTAVRYPAGAPHAIGVAAANADGDVDDWSIHGPQNDVSAPGANVLIAYYNRGDCLAGGRPYTSWAAGFVSGLAAQLRQRYPRESADQIVYRIEASADRPRQASRDDDEGWGEIRPYDALTMTLDPGRPGPPLPGAGAAATGREAASPVRALPAGTDPLAPARTAVLWWSLAAVGVGALALLLRPWLARTVRGRTVRGGTVRGGGTAPPHL